MSIRIMIVDDSLTMRKLIKNFVIMDGYDVIAEADNGVKAYSLYSELKPDIITLDISMSDSGINGIETAKAILDADPDAKILIVSSHSNKDISKEISDVGVKGFLRKPFNKEELIGAIEKLIDDGKARDASERKNNESMLYRKKFICPICKTEFESSRVRSKFLRLIKEDNDFCKYYSSLNPLFYEIAVCTNCGFAVDEEIQTLHIPLSTQEEMYQTLVTYKKKMVTMDYAHERTHKQALRTFLLALSFLRNNLCKKSKYGMMCLKTAWMYRYVGDSEGDTKYIKQAIPLFEDALYSEDFSEPQSEIKLTYLVGVLYFRTGDYQKAAKWLQQVMQGSAKSILPILLEQARDIWMEIRKIK